jgi:hypothetical protein
VFVFVVLVGPLALAFAIAAAVLSSGHVRSAEARDLLIGMTAASVAVLPLRAVVVPGDLVGPTLVDWFLGAELLVFVAVGLLALARAR